MENYSGPVHGNIKIVYVRAISPCDHGLINKKPWSLRAIYSVSVPQWNRGHISKFDQVK